MTPPNPQHASRKLNVLLAVVLLLAGQSFAAVHAAQFGTEQHEHNGVVCLAIVQDEQEDNLPVAHQKVAEFVAVYAQVATPAHPAVAILRRTLRPPPTGPPSV